MGDFRATVRSITVTSAADVFVWDAPCSSPFHNITVKLNSEGREYTAGDLEWEVFYVSKWEGTPFESTSTPVDGVSKASGIIVLPKEIDQVLWSDNTTFLTGNRPRSDRTTNPSHNNGKGGVAIVVKFHTDSTTDLKLNVIFMSELVSDVR